MARRALVLLASLWCCSVSALRSGIFRKDKQNAMKIAVDEEKQMVHVWNRGKEKQVTGTVFRDDELVSFTVSLSGPKKETSSFRVVSEFAVEELGETKARWTNTKARESAEVADPILPAGELLPSQLRSVLTREQRARVAHLSALPRAVMNATKAVELVVAAYDEDLSWLRMYANISTVYVKGKLVYGDGLGPASTLVRTLPNVGRETHTYLHHIVENYNELADVTVFTQGMAPMRGYQGHRLGGGHMHCGVTLHDFILSPSTLFVFTEMLSLDKVFHGVRAGYDSRIPCQHNRSSAIFPPTCYNARQIQGTGSLDFIMRRIAKTCSLQTNNTQDCTVLGFWRRFIKLPLPPMLVTWYSQGAVFAVTRDDIRKRPRSEYEQLLALASKSADPFVGYLMEWFWYHLLTSNPIACDPKAWPIDSFVSESDSHFDTRPNDLQLVNLQLAEQEQRAAGWSPQSGGRGGGSALYTRRNYDEATTARCCGYATLFTSASFLPALQVFLHSFTAQKRDSHPLVICFPLHNWELTALVGRELDKYPGLAVSVMGLSTIASPNPMHKRWRLNWMKLHLWNMTEFARIFYVDLDVLVLRPLDAVFAMPMTSHFFLGSSDVGRWTQPDSDKMNGGVFLLKPDKAVYARMLVEMRRNVSAYKSEEAEQGFFNFFFAGQCCLPVAYNSQKMLQRYWPSLWNLSEIRVLHFVGEKPWQHWSSSQYRDHWMAKSLVAERMRDDSWDADHFLELHNMWKQVYFQARRGEFTRLEMFAGYHSESCWKLLDSGPAAGTTARTTSVRLAGPMFRPHVDVDGPAVVPELRDSKFQKLVGAEFATMLAATVATQSNASFLGFASWNAAIKATWVQGASIDWTKVDFAEDLVYFWYGEYSPQDYWALQEKSHPGIGTALERVVGHSLPKLPPGFYPCGQYFLASRRIVHAYVDSAKQFVSNFTRHFAHSTICPFALASAADDGCLGHLLESHLNIWIALQGVGLRYVVEDAVAQSALERTRRKGEARNKQTRTKN